MPEIIIKNQNLLDAAIRRAFQEKMRRVFTKGKFLLNEQAEILKNVFANSEEFKSIKTKFKGEFGFTDEEVANLDRILELLVPENEITVTKIKLSSGQFLMSLEWVDFAKLKAHEYAQHKLTRLDEAGQISEITDIISWVEWLEEGASIKGYQFFRPSQLRAKKGGADPKAFSRSGQGLMKEANSNFWTFEPRRVFERIAKEEDGDFLKKGFGILVRKLAK